MRYVSTMCIEYMHQAVENGMSVWTKTPTDYRVGTVAEKMFFTVRVPHEFETLYFLSPFDYCAYAGIDAGTEELQDAMHTWNQRQHHTSE